MSFSLINPTGWTTGDLLTDVQINQLDQEHAAAIDGSGGGTYTLVAPLNISGDTVDIEVLETTYLETTADATLANVITDQISPPGGTLDVAGSVDVSGNVLAATANFTSAGTSLQAVNALITGNTYAEGGLRLRTITDGTVYDSAATLTVGTTPQVIIIQDGELSGDRTWTISNTNAQNGNFFLIKNEDTTHTIAVNSPTATPLITLPAVAAGVIYSALVIRIQGVWHSFLWKYAP